MIGSNGILFDSNVFIYNYSKQSEFYLPSIEYREKALRGEVKAIVACQNFTEFLSVIVNPKRTSEPLTVSQATKEIKKYLKSGKFSLIFPNEKTLPLFLSLVTTLKVKDPRVVFDIFLAATMLSNGVNTILTANDSDFSSIPNIKVIPLK